MNCTICGKPVVLVPSAQERSKRDVCGNTAAYYTALFPTHAACVLEKNRKETSEMIEKYYPKDASMPPGSVILKTSTV